MTADGGDAEDVLARYATAGVDHDELAARLQKEGAASFVSSWNDLLAGIAGKCEALRKAGVSTRTVTWPGLSSFTRRFSTAAQSTLLKNASMYFGALGGRVVEQEGVLPHVHDEDGAKPATLPISCSVIQWFESRAGRRVLVADRPADAAHLADAHEVGLPASRSCRSSPRQRARKRRRPRGLAAAAAAQVPEVVLVQDHAVVLEAEAARQLRVGGHLLLVDLAVGEEFGDAAR